jgi:diguanylate cyclase (GGDEF)-like protein/PAS domain S-box-containing protein
MNGMDKRPGNDAPSADSGQAGEIVGGSVQQIELEMQNKELRRAQVELDAARARYFDLYDLAPVGYCSVSETGLILEANFTAATLLGVARGTLVKQLLTSFIRKEDQNTFYLHCKQLLASGEPLSFELRMVKNDGTPFWAQLVATVAQSSDGVPVLRVVLSDVSEHRQAEDELRIAAVAFASPNGVVITDPKGVILRVNPAFTRLTGYSAEEAIGQSMALLKSGRQDRLFYQRMWDSLKAKGYWQGEIWNKRKNGQIYAEMLNITAIITPDRGIIHYVGNFTDITENKEAEAEIHRLAYYDPLTRLPNRRLLIDRVKQAMLTSARTGQHGALMFLDLDHFKLLNDTLGHDVGDVLLQQVAVRIQACVREGDSVARLGGDEFVVVLEVLSSHAHEAATQAEATANKILNALGQPYNLHGHAHDSTPSIGLVVFMGAEETIDELLKKADVAMYQAKSAGRNTARFFDPAMQAAVVAHAGLVTDLHRGLAQHEFVLHYQIQVNNSGAPIGAEALLRWNHVQRGLVAPAHFMGLAEQTKIILPLGQWVLETACAQLLEWARQPETAQWTMAVNVSALQFAQAGFVANVIHALQKTGVNPCLLKLELTESMLVNHLEDINIKMNAIKGQGVSFSLDDFGTGFSSLSYLKRLPLDQLKIDQSFVRNVLSNPNDAVITRSVVALGHSLGLKVIAEGVETSEQRDFLAGISCDAFQGFYFGHPVPASELAGISSGKPA